MSAAAFKSLPDGVRLARLAREVFDVLAQHTSFPWPIMQAQCRREEIDPSTLTPAELAKVIPHFANAVARFTSPETGNKVTVALRGLVDEG